MRNVVNQGTASAALYWVHVWTAWITYWARGCYCLNVGELVLFDITPKPNRFPWSKTLVQQLWTTCPHVPVWISPCLCRTPSFGPCCCNSEGSPWQSPSLMWVEQVHLIDLQNSLSCSRWNLSTQSWWGIRCFCITSENLEFCSTSSMTVLSPKTGPLGGRFGAANWIGQADSVYPQTLFATTGGQCDHGCETCFIIMTLKKPELPLISQLTHRNWPFKSVVAVEYSYVDCSCSDC